MASCKELIANKKAYELALEIHRLTKFFPKEEQFALTDQIRRSSCSVCSCIAEGFRKLRYMAHFISKITDAGMETAETQVWLDFSCSFGYINSETHFPLTQKSEEVGRLLAHMIGHPEKNGVASN